VLWHGRVQRRLNDPHRRCRGSRDSPSDGLVSAPETPTAAAYGSSGRSVNGQNARVSGQGPTARCERTPSADLLTVGRYDRQHSMPNGPVTLHDGTARNCPPSAPNATLWSRSLPPPCNSCVMEW
jgi:hypothetical protein